MRPILALAAAFALAVPLAAAAQEGGAPLVLDPSDLGGTCTCSVMEPPPGLYDCDDIIGEMRADMRTQRAQMTEQCVTQQTQACVAEAGPQACESTPPQFRATCNPAVQGAIACGEYREQIEAQCDEAIEAVFERDATPLLRQQAAACRARNEEYLAPWIDWCENVERPQACSSCDGTLDTINQLEAQFYENERWLENRRSLVVLGGEVDAEVATREAEMAQLAEQIRQLRRNHQILVDSGYCGEDGEGG